MKLKTVFFALMLMVGPVFSAGTDKPAPEFSLKDLEGNQVELKALRGSVVLVNFWATWCPPCNVEFPELNSLAKEYQTEKFKVLAINVDKKPAAVQKFLAKPINRPLVLTVLLDPESAVVAKYEAEAMPSSYIIDRKGNVRFIHTGYNVKDPAKWREEVKRLLSEGN